MRVAASPEDFVVDEEPLYAPSGEGAHTFRAGACWIQPPRIEHKVLDYSDDCEVLEIILPADFETVTLD